jgi:N-acetylglucosaminyl-diphospho-decaprenol L-rhamnosyltransferase
MADARTADEMPLRELLAEDFVTYDRNRHEPGFWAVGLHRVGTRIAASPSRVVRLLGGGLHGVLSTAVDWRWGINVPRTTRLGRRVRLWHQGGMLLRARSIGNDVHIRQLTTFGPNPEAGAAWAAADAADDAALPIVGDGADIGSGTCVFGPVTVGRNALVGANSVVTDDVPPGANMLGVPARTLPAWSIAGAGAAKETAPLPARGDRDGNPQGIGLGALLAEDFRTHGNDPLSPGFWAVAVHRLGNRRMSIRSKALRAPFSILYRAAYRGVVGLWGIDLPYNATLGRRLRIRHHGVLLLGVREVGDDVEIRAPLTMGLRRRSDPAKPTVGSRVQIEPNACLVGYVHIGDDSVIAPNTVLARDVPDGATFLGVPGRRINPVEYLPPAATVAPLAPGAVPPVDMAVIILNYRTPELTVACIDSLRAEIRPGIQVIIVDNASGDGSADHIEAHLVASGYEGWARVLRSPVNGGFASGNNLGIRSVDAAAYVLLNSDTVVCPGALAGLAEALAANPRAGMIAPRLDDADGTQGVSAFRFHHPIGEFVRSAGTGPITRLLRRYDVPLPHSAEPTEPDWVGFACVAIRREVVAQVGLLDEGFFMYFEDVDYCHRVRAAGWSILYWPGSRVVHYMGGSSHISSADTSRRRPARYYYEARTRYFAKYHGPLGPLAANLLWTAGRCIARTREILERRARGSREREVADNWTNILEPFRVSTKAPGRAADVDTGPPAVAGRAAPGNPDGIGLVALLREDFAIHGSALSSPGFWALAAHRFGNARSPVRRAALRAPLVLAHKALSTAVDWVWGIDLDTTTRVGRRVRFLHHGSTVIEAQSIGDDVQIHHNTTLGTRGRVDGGPRPTIESGVIIGVGAVILGDITIGAGTSVGANAVVLTSCPAGSRLSGVPAR